MDTKTVEAIIDEQFIQLAAKFKPQFGNQKHIDIVQQVAKITEAEKLLRKKQADAKGAKKLAEEITMLKRHTVFMLKNL